MLNFWNYVFFIASAIILIIIFQSKNPLKSLFLAELNWIIFVLNSFLLATINNEPRFVLISFFFFFLAALEVIMYLINFSFKKQCLNFLNTQYLF